MLHKLNFLFTSILPFACIFQNWEHRYFWWRKILCNTQSFNKFLFALLSGIMMKIFCLFVNLGVPLWNFPLSILFNCSGTMDLDCKNSIKLFEDGISLFVNGSWNAFPVSLPSGSRILIKTALDKICLSESKASKTFYILSMIFFKPLADSKTVLSVFNIDCMWVSISARLFSYRFSKIKNKE